MLAVLGLAVASVGVAMLAKVSWQQAATHMQARDWPTSQATILSVSLHEVARPAFRDSGDTARSLKLTVAYEFDVGGTRFASDRASLADIADIHDRRLKALYGRLNFARITSRTVPAAYDPRQPAQALLDRSFPWKPFLFHGGLGIAFLLVGIAFLAAPLRPAKNAA